MSSGASRPNPSGNHAGSSSSRPHSHHKGHDQRRGSGRDAAQLISLGEQHSLLQEKSKGGFICKMKFSNELPDLPFDPKFLAYPFDPSRLTRYTPTILEKMHKYALLTEPDLGIHIDLIEPEAYEPPAKGAELLPEDEILLRDDQKVKKVVLTGAGGQVRPNVPWLNKTAYYGNDDLYGMNQGGRAIKELPIPIQEEVKEMTPQEMQVAIEESFAVTNGTEDEPAQELKHPRDPSLKPVAVWSLFPDFARWANDYTEIVFDQDPLLDDVELREGKGPEAHQMRAALCSSGLIHLHTKGTKKNFAYMVPAPGTRKRKRLMTEAVDGGEADDEMEEDEPDRFQCLREYIENEARMYQEEWRDDHFVFTLEDGEENLQATYHPIKARTYLRKDKDVLTRNQMGTLNSDNIKGLLKSGKRLPLHDEAVIGSRELTAQEKEEMQDARWGIEGDPLLRHDGGGNRSGGGQNGTGEDRDGDGGQNGDGGAKRRVNQESSSSSSSSDDDEAATPKPANKKDDESDKSSDQPTPKPSPKPSAGSDSSGSSDSDG